MRYSAPALLGMIAIGTTACADRDRDGDNDGDRRCISGERRDGDQGTIRRQSNRD